MLRRLVGLRLLLECALPPVGGAFIGIVLALQLELGLGKRLHQPYG